VKVPSWLCESPVIDNYNKETILSHESHFCKSLMDSGGCYLVWLASVWLMSYGWKGAHNGTAGLCWSWIFGYFPVEIVALCHMTQTMLTHCYSSFWMH